MAEKRFTIAADAGGTMTDVFLVDEAGQSWLGKELTCPEDESKSYMGGVVDAAARLGLTSSEIHNKAVSVVYTGTAMLNALLTRNGRKTGLLITRGWRLMPFAERCLTWIGLSVEDKMHYVLHEHTARLVALDNVKEVAERITGTTYYPALHLPPGTELVPLNERDVKEGVSGLLDAKVEAIGICFLHSYLDPTHEQRAAEIARAIIAKRGLDIPVVPSHEICPLSMENQRLKSLLVELYCGMQAWEQLKGVEIAAKRDGYRYGVSTLLAYGGVVPLDYPRKYEAIVSGPTGGLIGAKRLLVEMKGLDNIICTDLGGTSFDVGIIAKGILPIKPEAELAGHRLNLSMLALDSVGAGTGMVVRPDSTLTTVVLGPESAGSKVGACLDYPLATLSDVDVALGYINPDYFLGGKVKLNRDAALAALQEQLAVPLGQEVLRICSRVVELIHARMVDHIRSQLLARGLDSSDFTLFAYGGSGPLHLWGVAEGLRFRDIVTVPWAAAFSAFGVAMGDYFHRYQKSVLAIFPTVAPMEFKMMQAAILNQAWQELEKRAYSEMEAEGCERGQVHFHYSMYARYIGQWSSWECAAEKGRITSAGDLTAMIDGFENMYTSLYPAAARFPEVGVAVTAVSLDALAERPRPLVTKYRLDSATPSNEAYKGKRKVYHKEQWIDFDIWEMDQLRAGNRVDGPGIIEHAMTTLVIPSEHYVEFDDLNLIRYRRK